MRRLCVASSHYHRFLGNSIKAQGKPYFFGSRVFFGMKTLQTILQQFGFVDSNQLKELSEIFPNMQLVIKWGQSPREELAACNIAKRIAEHEAETDDYVREVFISSTNFRMLKQVLCNQHSNYYAPEIR
jgi:hypothetical protein